MSDLADVGIRFHAEGVGETHRALDQLAEKSGKAEKATDRLNAAGGRAGSATKALADGIMRALAALERNTAALDALAAAQGRSASATQQHLTASRQMEAAQANAARAADRLAAANDAVASSTHRAGASARGAVNDFSTLWDAHQRDFAAQYAASMQGVVQGHEKASKSARLAGHEMANLGRQFADVGVQAAMGTNPLMIFIQQAPQIADVFATAAARGVGFRAALAGIGATLAPVAAALAPVAVVAGVVAAGFALMHRELSRSYPKDITNGLGLTEEQLKRVKDKTVTFGDTVTATFTVIGRHIMSGPVGDALKWLEQTFSKVLDTITRGALNYAADFVAFWVAAYKTITTHWRQFPQAMAAITTGWINTSIGNLEGFINAAIQGLNRILELANKIPGVKIGTVGPVRLGRMQPSDNPVARDFAETQQNTRESFLRAARGLGAEIAKEALASARKDALKQAGDANKGPKGPATPRDQTDERAAQIAGLLAQAKADELQAQLALTKDIVRRSELEKQIIALQLDGKQAQVDRQIANIQDDKGLSAAKKAELLAELEIVKQTNARVGALQQQAVEQSKQVALIQQASEARQEQVQHEAAILAAQQGAAKFEFQRREIGLAILAKDQEIERLKAQEALAVAMATNDQAAIARARAAIAAIEVRQDIETRGARGGMIDAFEDVERAMNQVAQAFEQRDWARLAISLIEAIGRAKSAFDKAGTFAEKAGAVAGLASGIGGMIGGRTGGAISGAAGGAMGMASLASTFSSLSFLGGPAGLAVGALVGGISSLFGSNKAKKREEAARREAAAQEAARKAAEVAATRRDLEIQLMELSGDKVGALAARRADELASMDATLRGLQEQVWARQDAAEREAGRRRLEIQLLEATGQSVAALALQREEELKSIDAALKPLQRAVWAVTDANQAVESANRAVEAAQDALRAAYQPLLNAANDNLTAAQQRAADARTALTEAYQREAGALNDFISRMGQAATNLRGYADELTGMLSGASGTTSLASAQSQFMANRTRALAGDETALGQVQALGETFRQALLAGAGTREEYLRGLAVIQSTARDAADVADDQASTAQRQLDALNKLVSGYIDVKGATVSVREGIDQLAEAQAQLLTAEQAVENLNAELNALLQINESVLTVPQAIAQLQTALAAQAAATSAQAAATQAAIDALAQAKAAEAAKPAATSGVWTAEGYLAKNPDVLAEYQSESARDKKSQSYLHELGIKTADDFARWHYNRTGVFEGRAFAAGGHHYGGLRLVGERGPELEVTGPARYFSAEQTRMMMGDNDDSARDEIRALRTEVADLKGLLGKIARNTDAMDARGKRQEFDGMYVRGAAPGEAIKTEDAA